MDWERAVGVERMNEETINKEDAVLYVDVSCSSCGRRMALSNATEMPRGGHFCPRCFQVSASPAPTDAQTGSELLEETE